MKAHLFIVIAYFNIFLIIKYVFIVKNLTNKNYLDLVIANTLTYVLTRSGGTKVSGHVTCEIQVVF